ncbi:MAG TPA: PIN domain-containing protein [Rhizomicrobium sp.]|nr:PIN domain-containing protein [Rhizomicrobium sp.]
MKVAIDTNVLAYAAGVNDPHRQSLALEVLNRLPKEVRILPVQVLGELFRVLVKKGELPLVQAREIVGRWRSMVPTVDTTEAVMMAAAELASSHRLPIWDAVIFAAAASRSCSLLLSEDMQEGFSWSGVTVVNPLKRPLDDRLAKILVTP